MSRRFLFLEVLSIYFSTSFFFSMIGRLGVDYHHQGLVFVTAKKVAEGYSMYGEVFNQYGPISTWIQALALDVFGHELRTLIYLSANLHALSVTVMYWLWARSYGKQVALFSIAIWISTCYYFRIRYPLQPWWGDFLLIEACLFLSISSLKVKSTRAKYLKHFSISLVIFSIVLTRFTSGLVIVSLVLISLLLTNKTLIAAQYVLTLGALGLSYFIYLWIQGSIDEFFYQTIQWPISWLVDVKPGQSPMDQVLYGLIFMGIPTVIVVKLLLSLADRGRVLVKEKPTYVFLMLLGILLWYKDKIPSTSIFFDSPNQKYIPSVFAQYEILWGIIVALFYIYFVNQKFHYQTNFIRSNVVIAASLLASIYPVPDPVHLWPLVLPAIGPVIYFMKSQVKVTQVFQAVCLSLVGVFIVTAVGEINSKTDSIEYQTWSSGPLVGMSEDSITAKLRTPIFSFLRNSEGNILNLCQDAMFGLRDRANNDPYFFLWGPGRNDTYFPSERRYVSYLLRDTKVSSVIVCNGRTEIKDYLIESGFSEIGIPTAKGLDRFGGALDVQIFSTK